MKKLTPSDFGTMRPFPLFLRMALPSTLSVIFVTAAAVVEGIILGQFGGGISLAVERIGMPVFSILIALSTVFAIGSSTLIAVKLGKGDSETANRLFTKSTLLLITLGILIGAFILIFGDEVLALLGAESDAIPLAYEFLVPFAIFCPFVLLFTPCDCFLRTCGRPVWGLITYVIYMVINLGLDAYFVICLNMGAAGVALASAIGMCVSTLFGFIPFITRKTQLTFVRGKLPLKVYGRMLYSGLPTLTTTLTMTVVSIGVNMILIKIGGTVAVAIYSVVLSIMPMAFAAAFGISDGIQQVIGYCYGKNNWKQIFRITNIALVFSALFSLIMFILFLVFGDTIIAMFLKSDEAIIIHYTSIALFLFSFVCLTRWVSIILPTFFIGIQKSTVALLLNLAETFIFPAACLSVLVSTFGFYGIWAAFPISALITAIITGIIYYIVGRKHRWGLELSNQNISTT